jgi:hypothetical protein
MPAWNAAGADKRSLECSSVNFPTHVLFVAGMPRHAHKFCLPIPTSERILPA